MSRPIRLKRRIEIPLDAESFHILRRDVYQPDRAGRFEDTRHLVQSPPPIGEVMNRETRVDEVEGLLRQPQLFSWAINEPHLRKLVFRECEHLFGRISSRPLDKLAFLVELGYSFPYHI